jgi:16S rRNA (guanine966-N2)-methyltransferase
MRLTGGAFRSRRLVTPRGDATRPTSDRVREALFSILGHRCAFEGARVLDLYAGTGALGLEAVSRGAASAVFVERRREALAALRENIAALGVGARSRVIAGSVEGSTGEIGHGFDIVFADPPYADVAAGAAVKALERIIAAGGLLPAGVLVLEHASKTAAPSIGPLAAYDSRTYGDTEISFYAAPEAADNTPSR